MFVSACNLSCVCEAAALLAGRGERRRVGRDGPAPATDESGTGVPGRRAGARYRAGRLSGLRRRDELREAAVRPARAQLVVGDGRRVAPGHRARGLWPVRRGDLLAEVGCCLRDIWGSWQIEAVFTCTE